MTRWIKQLTFADFVANQWKLLASSFALQPSQGSFSPSPCAPTLLRAHDGRTLGARALANFTAADAAWIPPSILPHFGPCGVMQNVRLRAASFIWNGALVALAQSRMPPPPARFRAVR